MKSGKYSPLSIIVPLTIVTMILPFILLSIQPDPNAFPQIEINDDSSYTKNKTKMARCFLIPVEGSIVDGYVRFYQDSEDKTTRFDIQIFAPNITELVIFENHPNNQKTCGDLGDKVLKIDLEEEMLVSKDLNILAEGEIPGINLFEEGFYNYSCAAISKGSSSDINKYFNNASKKRLFVRKLNENNEKHISACGKIQLYEVDSSYFFGISVTILNLLLGVLYFSKFGI